MFDTQDFILLEGPLALSNLKGLAQVVVILITLASAIVSIGAKAMIVYYITFVAPKSRPINHIILLDQVIICN